MKKKILIAGFLLGITGICIWGCKKAVETPSNPNPAQVHNNSARMTIEESDEIGRLHNVGLTQAFMPLGANPDPNDLDDALQSFYDENDLPSTTMNSADWMQDAEAANAAESFAPDNFANTLVSSNVIDNNGKAYIDLVVDKLEEIVAEIDTADHDCDPRLDSVFYNYVDSIQHVVVDDGDIDDDQNDRIQVTLSVIKFSGLYWFSCDEYGNRGANKAAKVLGLSTACKNCLKKKWGWLILADGLGGALGYLVSANPFSALAVALTWSGVALRIACPVC